MNHTAEQPSKLLITPFRFLIWSVMQYKWRVFLILIGETLQAISMIMIPYTVRGLIDALILYDPNIHSSVWEVAQSAFWMFLVANIAMVLSSRFSGTLLMFLAPKIRIFPRERLLRQLNNQSIDFFQDRFAGALGSRINEAANGVTFALWTFAFNLMPLVIMFLTGVVSLLHLRPSLGLLVMGWGIIFITGTFLLGRNFFYWGRKISAERAHITGCLTDIASNISVIKSYAHFPYEEGRFRGEMEAECKATWKFNFYREILNWFNQLLSIGLMLGCIALAIQDFQNGLITAGAFAFIFSFILMVAEQSRQLAFNIHHMLEYLGQVGAGVNTIMTQHEVQDKTSAKNLIVPEGKIEFSHVSFHYKEAPDRAVFSDLSLNIPARQKLGLIGPSGAGKTSFANLLLRLYDLESGEIRIDGQNIAEVTQDSLRSQIALIPQDTSLFHRTLMDNIRYGNMEASDEEVIEAAKKAYAHEFISDTPQGYETIVGERGVKLSGGQRQRIAIARAILKDAPILMLDEATSALDSESEKLIQDSLKDLMKGKTVIAIAHRLSTIAHLDRLIVMDGGQIVEDGSHVDLLKQAGLYAKLWNMQSGGFLPET